MHADQGMECHFFRFLGGKIAGKSGQSAGCRRQPAPILNPEKTYYKHTKTQVQSFLKENKPATETSSTQCPLVALQLPMWRGYTANCKWRCGASASGHKRKNSLFRWATDLELNWQSILVKSGKFFHSFNEYSVKHTNTGAYFCHCHVVLN